MQMQMPMQMYPQQGQQPMMHHGQMGAGPGSPPSHQQMQQQATNQQMHHSLNVGIGANNLSGVFVNSSNSSSSSLSSQPHPNQPSNLQPSQMPYLASSSDPIATHFSGLNSHNLPLAPPAQLTRSPSLPSKEDVIKKIEFITNSIKELLSNAKEGKHDEFSICSERICNNVSEMITLFPESLGSSRAENLLQVNQALMILQENALRLHEECNSYELNSLTNNYHRPQLNSTNQDYRFIYNNVIDKAAEVASSVKVIVGHYSC